MQSAARALAAAVPQQRTAAPRPRRAAAGTARHAARRWAGASLRSAPAARAPLRRRAVRSLAASSDPPGVGQEGQQEEAEQQQGQQQQQVAAASPPLPLPPAPTKFRQHLTLSITIAVVVVTAVMNRLLYKAAAVPLQNYIFFLAQLQTFGYLAAYYCVLFLRYRSGRVTRAMLAFPASRKAVFLSIGLVEALASLLGFLGAANLPGVVLPLLAQSILVWQVLLAVFVLKKRLGAAQYVGVSLVGAGVCLAAWPGGGGGASPLDGVNPFYALIFMGSMLFPALDTILKERVFRDARATLGRDLDLFVVNSGGSLAQALFVCLLLPVMTTLRGLSLLDLPRYVVDGWSCFRGLTPSCGSDCSGAPLLPVAYVLFNLAFNVAALELIRRAGNVAMSLTMSSIVPLTIYAFTIPMPFLPAAPPLGPLFALGTLTLLGGLGLFNAPLWMPAMQRALKAAAAEEPGGGGGGSASLAVAPK